MDTAWPYKVLLLEIKGFERSQCVVMAAKYVNCCQRLRETNWLEFLSVYRSVTAAHFILSTGLFPFICITFLSCTVLRWIECNCVNALSIWYDIYYQSSVNINHLLYCFGNIDYKAYLNLNLKRRECMKPGNTPLRKWHFSQKKWEEEDDNTNQMLN